VPLGGTPEPFASFPKSESARRGVAVRQAGIKLE